MSYTQLPCTTKWVLPTRTYTAALHNKVGPPHTYIHSCLAQQSGSSPHVRTCDCEVGCCCCCCCCCWLKIRALAFSYSTSRSSNVFTSAADVEGKGGSNTCMCVCKCTHRRDVKKKRVTYTAPYSCEKVATQKWPHHPTLLVQFPTWLHVWQSQVEIEHYSVA